MRLIPRKFFFGGRFKKGQYHEFVNAIYPALFNEGISRGMTEADAQQWAKYGTYQTAHESGYGTNSLSDNYNYGGMSGNKNYGSYDGFAKAYYDMIKEKWPGAFQAKDSDDYVRLVHSGIYKYSEKPVLEYLRAVRGVTSRVNRSIPLMLAPVSNPSTIEPMDLSYLIQKPDALRVARDYILPTLITSTTLNLK